MALLILSVLSCSGSNGTWAELGDNVFTVTRALRRGSVAFLYPRTGTALTGQNLFRPAGTFHWLLIDNDPLSFVRARSEKGREKRV